MSAETARVIDALVVMGVSGSGKTTVGSALAQRLGWTFLDADDLHPPANIAAMAAGHPLTDAERAPWLDAVAEWVQGHRPCVVACSALRRRYRDVLRGDGVLFVYLEADPALLAARLGRRTGHFMPPSLLGSQLDTLEPPGPDEASVTVEASAPLQDTLSAVLGAACLT